MALVIPGRSDLRFIIYAPEYFDVSSGVRALYRLCHLLNCAGYEAAIYPFGDIERHSAQLSPWNTPIFAESRLPSGTVVIYPEIVSGNPLQAKQVVRWVLNYPGVIGGDLFFGEDELVMVWDRKMLNRVNSSVRYQLDLANVLQVPVVNPAFIYPDSGIVKDVDCYFIHKGRAAYDMFHQRCHLPDEENMICIDHTVDTQFRLGEVLRRTKRLYSFDHATILFHEALIAQCEIFQVHGDGLIVDPRTCSAENRPCSQSETTSWPLSTFPDTYARDWDDASVARGFAELVVRRWNL
ncbi:MAG TPA: hypothetical protein VG488_11035 [Candidatus Angelobacter sp.]|jgi:hypothetical protein|nr:hypothetical protein [Candidatus Angelobacter sp.]